MKQYLELVEKVLKTGEVREDRTGTGTVSIFGHQSRYDLREGFPILTTKKIFFSSVVKELLWFLRGETNIKTLECSIWNEWANEEGELGPVYGSQWRNWNKSGLDQIEILINSLRSSPMSRRHIVSAWNPQELPDMALPPCHTMFQCYVTNNDLGTFLDLQLYQRSGDVMLGVPFNISSYALLLALLAREVGYQPRFFIHTIGDAHIYLNHVDKAKEQLTRVPSELPALVVNNKKLLPKPGTFGDPEYLTHKDFRLVAYEPQPHIHFDIAV